MSGKTIEKTRQRERPRERADDPAGHPLDAWLRRELQGLGPASAAEPLPAGMAVLAERLEARLRGAGGAADAGGVANRGRRKKGADRATKS